MCHTLCLLALAAIAAVPETAAQPRASVALGAAGVVAGGFGGAWRPAVGARAVADAPAYGGRVRAVLSAVGYEDAAAVLPEFTLVEAALGWGPVWGLSSATVAAGPLVGVAHMRFSLGDDGLSGSLQNFETEALVGAFGSVRVPVAGPVALWADAEVVRVALAVPRTLVTVGGGVAVAFAAPRALRVVAE